MSGKRHPWSFPGGRSVQASGTSLTFQQVENGGTSMCRVISAGMPHHWLSHLWTGTN